MSILLPILVLASCRAMPETRAERADLVDNARGELKNMTAKDPSLVPLLQRCAGYAVYPEVGKGGLLFAGAFGRGAVYQRAGDVETTADDKFLGYATVTQASVGGVIGGQMYAMLLIFEHDYDLEKFTGGDDLRFGAGASAIAITGPPRQSVVTGRSMRDSRISNNSPDRGEEGAKISGFLWKKASSAPSR